MQKIQLTLVLKEEDNESKLINSLNQMKGVKVAEVKKPSVLDQLPKGDGL